MLTTAVIGILVVLAYGVFLVAGELSTLAVATGEAVRLLRSLDAHAAAEAERVKQLTAMRGTGRELLAQRLAARLQEKAQ